MNTFNFIAKQLDLIEIEKNAEIDESKNLLNNCSLQRLQLKGLCLLKLKIEQKFTGLYGRTIVVLNSAVHGKVINTQYFSSGDIVSLSENSIAANELSSQKNLLTGTVTKVTSQSVSVAIDNEIENIDEQLNENDVFKIIKLCNDITHKRIKNALLTIKESKLNERSSHLADVLFLQTKPDQTILNSLEMFKEGNEFQFFNNNLDKSQQESVKFTFEQKDLAIIHGPPGTGKTTTLVEIIKQNCLKYKQKILCCAPSNIAVDNLVERLTISEKGYSRIKMIRLGHPARLLEHIQEYSLDSVLTRSDQYKLANEIKGDMDKTLKSMRKTNHRGEREGLKREMRELRKELYQRENRAMKEVLQSSDCILATLTTAHEDGPLKHLKDGHFDIIIIDECSQAMEAACWIPLIKGARKVILAGDHLQLPPTIISSDAAKQGLDVTLMKRLIDALGDISTRMLTIQYRMNKLIMNWISEKLYESRLQAHESVAKHLLCDLENVETDENTSTALVVIDTDGCDMVEMVADSENGSNDEESKANEGEANIVCSYVSELIKAGVKPETIAVITPYNLQMELIKAKLHTKYDKVEVKSVDGFQGREKEAVILSLVRSNQRGEVGFLADQRRINVAITRARRHLCVVCDSQTCKNNEFLKSFLDYCEKYGDIRSGFDYTNSANEVDGIDSIFEDIKFQKLKISDKKTVKKEIDSKKQVTTTKIKKTKISEPVFIETPEDKLFQEEVLKIIDQLKDLNNNKQTHEFPNSLNTRQRRIVHELAEKHELNHESRGENEQRFIVLSFEKKKLEKTEIKETENIVQDEQEEEEEQVVESNRSKKKRNRQKVKKVIETIEPSNISVKKEEKDSKNLKLLGEFEDQEDSDLKYRNDCTKCIYCTKFILKVNYLMHELHCSKINKKQVDNISSSASASSTSTNFNATTSKTKNDKIKKNPIENAKTDDFEELLDLFQKSNNVCNFKGCKVLVKTLGQNCEFCNNRFCLQHSLAEIHGCGDEAKKAARAHIRKTGDLNVNGKATSYSQEIKHKINEKKLHEKIEKMKAERTGSNKKDKSNI